MPRQTLFPSQIYPEASPVPMFGFYLIESFVGMLRGTRK